MLSKMIHTKCRTKVYPSSNIKRLTLEDEQVPWSFQFNYIPPFYTSKALQNKPWADPDIKDTFFRPKWNEMDGKINRKSHTGLYQLSDEGKPLNPSGRTGLAGRGILGKWGPNHAADPIVTRWKRMETDEKKILQFCAIQRNDCNQWAIPGGMVDAGEQINETLLREFLEEALNTLDRTGDKAQTDVATLKAFFKNGTEIYKGYVDDPRNTDNAWMETVAVNFHDENGSTLDKVEFHAGDDAKNVRWLDIDQNLDLYASHSSFIQQVAKLHNALW